MFPDRYFSPSYFARSYFARVLAAVGVLLPAARRLAVTSIVTFCTTTGLRRPTSAQAIIQDPPTQGGPS